MTRLTNKYFTMIHQSLYDTAYMGFNIVDLYNKLKRLEDIEEELGIDLITLFKASKEGIWTNFLDEISYYHKVDYNCGENNIYCYDKELDNLCLAVEDYGKTWGLTKEELENDK